MNKRLKMSKPNTFKFKITEILHYRRQSVEFSGSEVLYEIFYLYKSITRIFRPTEEDWIEFWKKINDLDVWGWEESYHNLCLDGEDWSLSIEHEGKSISSEGGNAYPGVKGIGYGKVFTNFLQAIDSLIGEKLFLIDPYIPKFSQKDHAQSVVFKSFSPVFRYKVKNGLPLEEEIIDEELWQSDGVVYARTHKQEIVYIGKTNATLKSRVQDHLRRIPKYSKPKDLSYRSWAEGKTITIFAHKPKNKNYLGLSVPIHTGLEHALIDAIKPTFVSRR